jgi:hypothetical protein
MKSEQAVLPNPCLEEEEEEEEEDISDDVFSVRYEGMSKSFRTESITE